MYKAPSLFSQVPTPSLQQSTGARSHLPRYYCNVQEACFLFFTTSLNLGLTTSPTLAIFAEAAGCVTADLPHVQCDVCPHRVKLVNTNLLNKKPHLQKEMRAKVTTLG